MGRRNKGRMNSRPNKPRRREALPDPESRVPSVEKHVVDLYKMPEYAFLPLWYWNRGKVVSPPVHTNCTFCGASNKEGDGGPEAEDGARRKIALPLDASSIVPQPNARETAVRSYHVQLPHLTHGRVVTEV